MKIYTHKIFVGFLNQVLMYKCHKLFAVLLLSIVFSFSSVFAYAYTPFSLTTGKGTIAFNPFFFGSNTNNGAAELFIAYGATEKIDVWLSINTFNQYSGMLRYDIGKSNILAIRANHTYISPQYHMILENERFALQTNIAAQFDYAYINKPGVYGIFAPVLKIFNGMVDIYYEINPGYYTNETSFMNLFSRDKGFDLDLVPGIGFAIGDVLFSVGCPIYDVTNDPTLTYGAWIFFSIGGLL